MTETVVADPHVALNAPPLLATFNRAGILTATDVQVARRLGALTGEANETVLLAVALTVRALRGGSVCVTLDDLATVASSDSDDAVAESLPWPDVAEWRAAIMASPLVAVGADGPADRPARWVAGRLYLDRYWRDEQLIRAEVNRRLNADPLPAPETLSSELARLFPRPQDRMQRLAAATSVLTRFAVVTGGPGTGKTTTVAGLLALLQSVAGPGLRVALAAPTGKAAARLQEAVTAQVQGLSVDDQRRVGTPEATTIHRLLGWKPASSTRFRYDRSQLLNYDVVVVDECSMVSLPLMARLLEALRPDARLVLVGDPDQLASVEAGAVLGDLVARPPVADTAPPALVTLIPEGARDDTTATSLRNGVVRLSVVHRFTTTIGELADAIRAGDAETVLATLKAGAGGIEFIDTDDVGQQTHLDGLREDAAACGGDIVLAARAGNTSAALAALDRHRLLLAHRHGPHGVTHWATHVESWVRDRLTGHDPDGTRADAPHGSPTNIDALSRGPWYPGRPLLVTVNDRDSGLYNGDTGVVVVDGDGGLVAAFGDPQRPLLVRPHRLPKVETVHAMTVHRGQGSQFTAVSIVLPPPTSPLLTRELLYTAVTRARERVRVVGSADAVRAAVERPVQRASGLREPQ